MPRESSLEPRKIESREAIGKSPWCLNVPSELSPTGNRQQLFFATKKDAMTHVEKLKARQDNFGSSLNSMTPSRIAKAAEAYNLLDPLNIDLLDAVRVYLKTQKARTASIPFLELFNLYLNAKKDRNREYLRELRITRDRMPQLHRKLVCDITPKILEPILNAITPGGRGPVMRYLRAVFRFGVKRSYLAEDPISRLEFPEHKKAEVEIISIVQVERMLFAALNNDVELLPFLVLGFFCGIRPDGELQKLQWSDIYLDDRKIVMRPEITKKNRRRFVDIQPNALAWLQQCPDKIGGVVKVSDSALRRKRLLNRKIAGVINWPNSGMRHTFCSCHLAHFKDQNSLVLQSGHDSPDIMYNHYYKAVTNKEAEKFWSIVPNREATNVVPFVSSQVSTG